jgi:hypothetical protein
MLERLAHGKRQAQNRSQGDPGAEITINIVTGNKVLDDYHNPAYFTFAFPTLLPFGTGKHFDSRRPKELQLSIWVQLLLKHSSGFALPIFDEIY